MGMFKCCVYVFNGPDTDENSIRAGLKKIAKDCEDSEWFSFYNKLNLGAGLPDMRIRAWAGYRQSDDWFIASDTYTEQAGSLENLEQTAKFYSEVFGAEALAVSVCDSDCSFIAFADGEGHGFSRIAGRWDGYAEETDEEMLSVPSFLLDYIDEEDKAELVETWKKDFVFEEERLEKTASLLHAPSFYFDADEDDESPKDVELIEEYAD
ncbi:MAG: hypothetical protein VB112_06965 [Oscillospiraceae bacterium]|nr:hypothetical protein [Oscillospiraceae bacterium]